jgi:hypothetical protein
MTAPASARIGFDRRIEVDWLDAAAARVAAGQTPSEVRASLKAMLAGVLAGESSSSARGKTLTVLARIWVTVPAEVEPLRAAAVELLPSASAEERLAIHWALTVAAYPFFCDVAAQVGKLLALHGELSLSQLVRRMTLTLGERSTLPRAVQRVVRTMVRWGVLREADRKGTFLPAPQRTVLSSGLAELMVEALLVSSGRGMVLTEATTHPALFAFDVRLGVSAARNAGRLRVLRQGDQTDYVELVS